MINQSIVFSFLTDEIVYVVFPVIYELIYQLYPISQYGDFDSMLSVLLCLNQIHFKTVCVIDSPYFEKHCFILLFLMLHK